MLRASLVFIYLLVDTLSVKVIPGEQSHWEDQKTPVVKYVPARMKVMGSYDEWSYKCLEFKFQCSLEWKMFLAEKRNYSFVYWILQKKIIFDPVKTSVFLPLEPGLSLAGRIHSVVGRLICLGVFVSGDGLVRTQAVAIIVTGCQSFLLVSALWPYTVKLLFQFHTFFQNCDNRNTCFCPFELSSTFQNVTYSVICLSYYWLHVKCIKLRYIRNNVPFIVGFCIIQEIRGSLWTNPSFRFCDSEKKPQFFHLFFQNKTAQLAIVGLNV